MTIRTARTVSDYDGVVRALDRGESIELTSSDAYSGRKVVAIESLAAGSAEVAALLKQRATILSWFEKVSDAYVRGCREDVDAAIEDMQSVIEDLGLDPAAATITEDGK